MAAIETGNVTRTATVFVRHSDGCKHAERDPHWR